jgi:hypothetical protein
MKRAVRALLSLTRFGLIGLPLTLGGSTPAGAAPPVPVLLSPADGGTVFQNPVLQWDNVVGAAKYRVQVSTVSTFTSTVYNTLTFNTKATPPTDLAQGTYFWRVQSIDLADAASAFSASWTFVKGVPDAPTTISPVDDAVINFPDDPLLFRWEGLPGAKTYEIQIDDDADFVAPLVSETAIEVTSFSLPNPQAVGQTYFWHVRAKFPGGGTSQWSDTQAYEFEWPSSIPVLTSPPDTFANAIEEVVLDWNPVPGAVAYDIQVSPDIDFGVGTMIVDTQVLGTRYSRPITPDNGDYYWRVRAVNAGGGQGKWTDADAADPRRFKRAWPAPDAPPNHRVTLLEPANGAFTVKSGRSSRSTPRRRCKASTRPPSPSSTHPPSRRSPRRPTGPAPRSRSCSGRSRPTSRSASST